jgi:hypothetical protein
MQKPIPEIPRINVIVLLDDGSKMSLYGIVMTIRKPFHI